MYTKTLAELSFALAHKQISSEELTKHFLARIERFNSTLNSFITVCPEQALAQARAIDQIRAQGNKPLHPLAGIPIAQKDNFCTKGIKTTCGSKMLETFIAPYNATLVDHCNQAGMVMLGKTNMDEFAMGSSNENSYYGPVKNPWDLKAVPGGSSGGSAAAVAARLTPGATGTDTGGSIRQPAAMCGITGIKPTYGRISRYGMIAYASSLDQGGPMAYTAEDTAMLLNVMAGFDEKDSTSIDHPVPDYTANLNDSIAGLRIGLPKEYFGEGLDPQIASAIELAVKALEKLGATVKSISLPNSALSLPAYYVIAPAECSSNLARYDGVRFGHRCHNPKDIDDLYKRSRSEGFGIEVKRRIMIGTYVLSTGFFDAYYLKAQQIRRLISDDFHQAFDDCDVIAGPATPAVAFNLGDKCTDPISMYLSDIYTISANLAGLPGMSIPAGMLEGKPIGLQLIGKHFSESQLLNIAHQYQQVTDWHTRIPPHFTE